MKIFTVLALGECPIADGISAVLKSKGYHPLGVSNAYCRSGFNAEAAAEVTNTVRPYQLANTIAVVAVGLEGNMASVLHGFVLIVDAQSGRKNLTRMTDKRPSKRCQTGRATGAIWFARTVTIFL